MFGINCSNAAGNQLRSGQISSGSSGHDVKPQARRIALLRNGVRHGSITRLITPWDIGELTQPFVFLGYSELATGLQPVLGIDPDHNMAIVTHVLSHEPLRTFQLWIGLPPSHDSAMTRNRCRTSRRVCLESQQAQEDGPVRVMLGEFGRARSALAPIVPALNYFHVRLKDRQSWRYRAPEGHNVTWLAIDRGILWSQDGERICWEQIALFGDSQGEIEVHAEGDVSFVLGSARRRAHPLAQGDQTFGMSDTGAAPDETETKLKASVALD